MKNVRESQLKKCIFLTQTEMENILSKILNKTITVNVDLYGLSACTEEDDGGDIDNNYLCEILSQYFEANVTSIHIDDCDYVGIWVCYK